jgi:hypothetical protein
MLKFRLVAVCTLIAIVGLVVTLTALNRHRNRHAAKPASSQGELVQHVPAPSEASPPAPSTPPTPQIALASPNGIRDYSVLPDGRPVPELPASAPKTCGFGAILFTYEGVQLAPRHPRSKSDAAELAKKLIPEAEKDFADAAKRGDPGSLADAGSIARGILERSVEYQLFTLEKGKVHPEPIETPRGYWILRRTR